MHGWRASLGNGRLGNADSDWVSVVHIWSVFIAIELATFVLIGTAFVTTIALAPPARYETSTGPETRLVAFRYAAPKDPYYSILPMMAMAAALRDENMHDLAAYFAARRHERRSAPPGLLSQRMVKASFCTAILRAACLPAKDAMERKQMNRTTLLTNMSRILLCADSLRCTSLRGQLTSATDNRRTRPTLLGP